MISFFRIVTIQVKVQVKSRKDLEDRVILNKVPDVQFSSNFHSSINRPRLVDSSRNLVSKGLSSLSSSLAKELKILFRIVTKSSPILFEDYKLLTHKRDSSPS